MVGIWSEWSESCRTGRIRSECVGEGKVLGLLHNLHLRLCPSWLAVLVFRVVSFNCPFPHILVPSKTAFRSFQSIPLGTLPCSPWCTECLKICFCKCGLMLGFPIWQAWRDLMRFKILSCWGLFLNSSQPSAGIWEMTISRTLFKVSFLYTLLTFPECCFFPSLYIYQYSGFG